MLSTSEMVTQDAPLAQPDGDHGLYAVVASSADPYARTQVTTYADRERAKLAALRIAQERRATASVYDPDMVLVGRASYHPRMYPTVSWRDAEVGS